MAGEIPSGTAHNPVGPEPLAGGRQAQTRRDTVPIQSLEPWPLDVIRPIYVVLQEDDGAFVASFIDANINASGESQLEAVEMLKDMLASSFRLFLAKEAILGKEPRRQLAVLRQFIRIHDGQQPAYE